MLVTVILNVSVIAALPLSVAVILTSISPTFAFKGVPLNVRVAAVNVSQEGSALPSESVAVYVKLSPTSTSANTLELNWKLNALSSAMVWSAIALASVGASFTSVTATVKVLDIAFPPASTDLTTTE